MELGELTTRQAHESGADITIRLPETGELSDLVITVQGVDSKAWRASQKKAQRDIVRQVADGKTITDFDGFELDALVACTIGWKGLVKDGKEYKFTASRCRKLYEDAPYVRDQVDAFIGKRANFMHG